MSEWARVGWSRCVSGGWVWAFDRAKPRGSVAGNTQIDATSRQAKHAETRRQAGDVNDRSRDYQSLPCTMKTDIRTRRNIKET